MAKSRVIGLDIGTTAVRAAELEFGSGGPAGSQPATVQRFGQVPLPRGAVRDGEVAEPQTVASALRQLWAEAKFSHRDVILGVGNQRVVVRDLEMPAMPMAQLRSSLPFQVQDMLPVAVDDVLLDYYPHETFDGPNGRMVRGLLVAATKDTIQANTIAAESAGLRPVQVDLSALAMARVASRGDHSQAVVGVVDVGARVTSVVVVDHGVPRFVRLMPSGGQDLTDGVAAELGVTAEEAEAIKREVGLGYAAPPHLQQAATVVEDVSRNLIDSIRNTFVYYAGNHPGAGAQGVVLTGGGASLAGFGQYLASACRIPVWLGNPMATLRPGRSLPPADRLEALMPTMSLSIGLAFGVAA